MKNDQIEIIPWTPSENSRLGKRPLDPWILLSAESQMQPCEAFVIFIVILLTQFPTQHRYTDIAPDLQITKIPYKAIPTTGVQSGASP